MYAEADDPVAANDVIAALERILSSDMFASAPRNRSFLAYVVTETLAGRGARLSERTVGRHALGRPDDFDGRLDASVRVRATRVRKALDAYYSTAADPVRITLDPGTYTPEFRRSGTTGPLPSAAAVVITTTGGAGDSGLVEAIGQELADQLATFPGLRVVGPLQLTEEEPRSAARRLELRFVLHVAASVPADSMVVVDLVLWDAMTDARVWATQQQVPVDHLDAFRVPHWAGGIAGELGDYCGVILTRSGESQTPGNAVWQAMQAYYSLFNTGDRQSVVGATEKLTRVVAAGGSPAAVTAALAHCLSVRAAYGFSDDPEADLTAATSLAQDALDADPRSGTAHLALATTALLRNNSTATLEHASAAVELSALHPSTVGTAGLLMAYAGQWDAGVAALRRALDLNPSLPGYSRTLLAMDHLFAGDDALALAEATLIATPTEVWGPYFRALALMGLGYREQAHTQMDAALAIDATVLDADLTAVDAWVQLTGAQRQILTDRLRMFDRPG